MRQEYVVRVGEGYVFDLDGTNAGYRVIRDLDRAKRFTREEATAVAEHLISNFCDPVFVAHQARPEKAIFTAPANDESFVVRVGPGFISQSDSAKSRLITTDLKKAKRYTKETAELMICFVASAFPNETAFVAHQNNPDCEYDRRSPCEYIVAVGRRYLSSFKRRQPSLTFSLADAKRHRRLEACDIAEMLRLAWPDRSIHAAHENTPYISIRDVYRDEAQSPEDPDQSDEFNSNEE